MFLIHVVNDAYGNTNENNAHAVQHIRMCQDDCLVECYVVLFSRSLQSFQKCFLPPSSWGNLQPDYTTQRSIKSKSKAVPLHAMEALWGERRYSSYSFTTSALDGVSGQHHAPAALYPRYPFYRRLGGPQSRSGHRGYRKNPLPRPGIEPRSPGRPVRSQTLYCLS
jgi:hypothetical protein